MQLEKQWWKADVFVINAPVASGKSRMAKCIADWQTSFDQATSILTPTNVLVDQYAAERWNDVSFLYRAEDYRVYDHYKKALADAQSGEYPLITNFYCHLAHRLYRPVLVVDEAHNLQPFIQELAAKKLWAHHVGIPEHVYTYKAFRLWLRARQWWWHKTLADKSSRKSDVKLAKTLKALFEDLTAGTENWLVKRSVQGYRGQDRLCFSLRPLKIEDHPPVLWPIGKVKKIVLLSATITERDARALGFGRRRISFIQTESPIPPENRPVFVNPVANMSRKTQDAELPALIAEIKALMSARPHEKGLIHATYGLALKIREALGDEPRLLSHGRLDKNEVLAGFRASNPTEGQVFLASGLYEGVDLPYDACRWQIITKVPWPSLGEPTYEWLAATDRDAYQWEALKPLLQASGRVCRKEDDYGETYIWDSSFSRLDKRLMPKWFTESVVAGD